MSVLSPAPWNTAPILERWWFDFDIPRRSPELSEIRILNEFPDTDAGMRHLLGLADDAND